MYLLLFIHWGYYFQVIYEGLTGHRVGWKKALNFLNARFSNENKSGKDTRPCILLIDELDLLVTRNQAVCCAFYMTDAYAIAFSILMTNFHMQVLYNILDWPTKPNSKLIVIGGKCCCYQYVM